MVGLTIEQATLAIIIGTLAAVVFALRVLVYLERRIANIDQNIERMVGKVAAEELKIERSQQRIVSALGKRSSIRRTRRSKR